MHRWQNQHFVCCKNTFKLGELASETFCYLWNVFVKWIIMKTTSTKTSLLHFLCWTLHSLRAGFSNHIHPHTPCLSGLLWDRIWKTLTPHLIQMHQTVVIQKLRCQQDSSLTAIRCRSSSLFVKETWPHGIMMSFMLKLGVHIQHCHNEIWRCRCSNILDGACSFVVDIQLSWGQNQHMWFKIHCVSLATSYGHNCVFDS